jgi:hypothetical protein
MSLSTKILAAVLTLAWVALAVAEANGLLVLPPGIGEILAGAGGLLVQRKLPEAQ